MDTVSPIPIVQQYISTGLLLGKSFWIQERPTTQSGEKRSSSDEELSPSDCIFKRSRIQKDFPNNSWKLRSPKSLFKCTGLFVVY